jgi:hypothetical protein
VKEDPVGFWLGIVLIFGPIVFIIACVLLDVGG